MAATTPPTAATATTAASQPRDCLDGRAAPPIDMPAAADNVVCATSTTGAGVGYALTVGAELTCTCEGVPSNTPIAEDSSLPELNRCAGSFPRHRSTSRSTSGGIEGTRLDGAGAGSRRCIAMTSPAPSASNGG